MKITISYIILLAGVALLTIPALAADQPPIKRVPVHTVGTVSGQELFREYCAVCHGSDAKGTGPAAAALKVRPADLTAISRRNSNKFPEIHMQRVIDGEDEVMAHGSREMPTWGQIFRRMNSNQDLGAVRVYNLVKYIEQLQEK